MSILLLDKFSLSNCNICPNSWESLGPYNKKQLIATSCASSSLYDPWVFYQFFPFSAVQIPLCCYIFLPNFIPIVTATP